MGLYWDRAQLRYDGNIFLTIHWTNTAPFYSYFLTYIFKIISYFNLLKYKLEIIIILDIVYSTISVYFLYLISTHLFKDFKFSLLVTFFYAFSYPLIYICSFILSENLAIPTLIISVYLLFTYHKNKTTMFFTGCFLALAVATRPALILMGLSFFFYIAYADKPSCKSTLRGMCFILGLALVLLLVCAENNYISKGVVKSLTGHGGVSFFIEQCKPVRIESTYKGEFFVIEHPSFNGFREKAGEIKLFQTDHPFHDQEYFYKLGIECIKKNPYIWFENLKDLEVLLFGPFLPSVINAKGFVFLIKIWSYIIFFMLLSFGILYRIKEEIKIEFKKILFFLSLIFVIFLTSYFFAADQRYMLPGYFAIYLIFFTIISKIKKG